MITGIRLVRIAGFLLILTSLIYACKSASVYSESEKINDYSWNARQKLLFTPDIRDTVSAFDINLVIRTNSSYPYRNIFLFISTTSPEGRSIKDTVEYYLADEKGNWYGSGLGDINDLAVPYKTNVIFPIKGVYSFSVQHGMRDENLEGVTDIGLHISRRK